MAVYLPNVNFDAQPKHAKMSKNGTIQAFFNARHAGDTFAGLNSSIEGKVSDRVIAGLPEFLTAAGRDYYIAKSPAFQRFAGPDGPAFAEVAGQFHLTRSSDDRVVSPHTVTDSYAPLSLVDMADELQPWCDAGWCSPDGVYSARNESLEILSLRLDAAGELPAGEKFSHYVIFQNSHATGGTAKGKIISFRIVCANTFAAAVSANADFSITHRVAMGDAEAQKAIMSSRARDAVRAWDQVREHIADLAKRIEVFSAKNLSVAEAKTATDKLLGIASEEKASAQSKNKRDAIMQGFARPQAGTNGRTVWDWINGVTYANSSPLAPSNVKSKVSAVDRIVRNIDTNGTGLKFERAAQELALELVGV